MRNTSTMWQLLRLMLLVDHRAPIVTAQSVSRPVVTKTRQLLDDHVRFVDHDYVTNPRNLNPAKFDSIFPQNLIHGRKLILELNMVAEQASGTEPPRRRLRVERGIAMDVDVLADDDDDLAEHVLVGPTPLPTALAPATTTASAPSASVSRRGVDPKLFDKPDGFDGTGTTWRVWKLRVSGWLRAVDVRFPRLLPEAEKSDVTLQDVEENILSLDTFLYTQLLAWLEGEQLETLLRGPENCGFEDWRSLVRAQERLEPTRKVMQLEKLLHPQFGDRMTWRREWLSWEAECLRHAVLLGGVLTGDVKISIVRQRAPADLRQYLMLTAKDYGGDY